MVQFPGYIYFMSLYIVIVIVCRDNNSLSTYARFDNSDQVDCVASHCRYIEMFLILVDRGTCHRWSRRNGTTLCIQKIEFTVATADLDETVVDIIWRNERSPKL